MTEYRFTVTGPPRTKKTSNRLVKAGRNYKVLPSKAWVEWCRDAVVWYESGRSRCPVFGINAPGGPGPFMDDGAYNITALFYRDANRGDSHGFYQVLADLLEKRGVIANDRQLVSWDGSRLLKDKMNPRTEVTLTPVEELMSAIRGDKP